MGTNTWNSEWLEPEGWWLRSLEHHRVTSPPTNQRKVIYPADLPTDFAHKNFPKNHRRVGVFWAWATPFSLLGPAINLSPLQNLDLWVCLASLCVRRTNLGSTTTSPPKEYWEVRLFLSRLCRWEIWSPGDLVTAQGKITKEVVELRFQHEPA